MKLVTLLRDLGKLDAQIISKLVREEAVDISKWVFPDGMTNDKESVTT